MFSKPNVGVSEWKAWTEDVTVVLKERANLSEMVYEIVDEKKVEMAAEMLVEKNIVKTDERVAVSLKLDGVNGTLQTYESFLLFVGDCFCERRAVKRMVGARKRTRVVLSCVVHM